MPLAARQVFSHCALHVIIESVGFDFILRMPYTATHIVSAPGTFRQGAVFDLGNIMLSQIITNFFPFYVGQSFAIEETLSIYSTVDDYSVLRSEDRWYEPKEYRGTWQRYAPAGVLQSNNTDYGLIRSGIHNLSHTRMWTVAGNPNKAIQQGDGGTISQCNFYLTPDVYLFQGEVTPLPGSTLHKKHDVLTYRDYIEPATVEDAAYPAWFAGVGLYMYQGCSAYQVDLNIAAVGVLRNAANVWSVASCELGEPNCDDEFDAFVLTINDGHPIDSTSTPTFTNQVFSSPVTCATANGGPCTVGTFKCTSGEMRTYYTLQSG